ncbi:hypothetical protein ACFOOP_19510 [Marinicaulis aureus]|uniref:Uncharacterized protein n=1 Tax=Hyphococcus aureus TaxID=2666033 RepID=A0ABW1KZ61_9PROT
MRQKIDKGARASRRQGAGKPKQNLGNKGRRKLMEMVGDIEIADFSERGALFYIKPATCEDKCILFSSI